MYLFLKLCFTTGVLTARKTRTAQARNTAGVYTIHSDAMNAEARKWMVLGVLVIESASTTVTGRGVLSVNRTIIVLLDNTVNTGIIEVCFILPFFDFPLFRNIPFIVNKCKKQKE